MHEVHLPAPGLLDRVHERVELERLVSDVCAGQSRVLVLRGEAGVGKTVLLRHMAATAGGCEVSWAAGIEGEMELAFAGLHALCAPMLDRLDHLPGPQRDALCTAFGLSDGPPPDRFFVGLAVLSLLADAAERQPLLCIVDDAQWLDLASAQTLAFVARRLLAERVGLVFGLRDGGDEHVLEGLPHLILGGLAGEDARKLLDATVPGPIDERVKSRILFETRGNPLAVIELPRGLTPAELAGGFGLPDPGPLSSRIERTYGQRVTALPADSQRLLLAAAAEPLGDLSLLWRAAERLEIDRHAGAPAEAAGLIELGARVRFPHPLVRSAIYRAADPGDRRTVHGALADVTDPAHDPDRRAWHLAHASLVPDEAVAAELMRSADRAQARGGLAAAAAFLQRAAELTPDAAARVERSLTAARAKLDVADSSAAWQLVEAAQFGPLDPLQRARLERLRAQITFAGQRGRDAPPLLLEAARRLEPLDVGLAQETYLEALASAMYAGRLGSGPDERAVAEAARATDPGTHGGGADALLAALVTRFTEGYPAGAAPLRDAVRWFADDEGDADDPDRRWLWLACRLAQDLWDEELWERLAVRGVQQARETGALSLLPVMANYLAAYHVHSGDFATAAALVDEVEAITQATGLPPLRYASCLLATARGDRAQELFEESWRNGMARGEGAGLGLWWWLVAMRNNAEARYAEALQDARHVDEHEDVIAYNWTLVELVEAGARGGAPDEAAAALARLRERTQAAGTSWALGVEARCGALCSDDEALYRASIEHLTDTHAALDLARSQLVYGEWLRRESRRTDARAALRAAYDGFSRMGAASFAERARRALLATGETVRRITADTRDALTPQEIQVAQLARDGLTNSQIGAQLFISPRTVEYHLHKVFRKLDVSSRKGLRDALPPGR